MSVYAVKQGSESNERLMNRWKKQVQETRLVKKLRETARFSKHPSKRQTRLVALKRSEFRAQNRKQKFYSNM